MSNTPTDLNDNDFVLKHRIVGAAFLLFFGALVLPWLLGPPSEASKKNDIQPVLVDESTSTVSADLESQILAELQDSINDDEQVYISKITPAGQANVVSISNASKQNSDAVSAGVDNKEKLAKEKLAKEKLAKEKLAKEKLAKEKLAKDKLAKDKLAKDKASQKIATVNSSNVEPSQTSSAAADLAAALAAEASSVSSSIDSGWVVQVGMFVDKKKASNVFKELGDEGFAPTTSVVDTNLGLGTGTRVWLGPFKQRQEAVDMKARLSEKTGTTGFIRAYP